jgi:hypothetical protein
MNANSVQVLPAFFTIFACPIFIINHLSLN